ncbi:MAG: M48 family peptidase, partial [Verrucomicrobia bacterium]|nr:M48 family peptidase [Verrucomicrobiota bacterium]
MIASLIVGTLVSYYLLDSLAKFLNLKSIRTEVPPEFANIYDSDRYRRSQSYTKANTLFDIVSQTVALAALFIFWCLGGFRLLDDWLRSFNLPVIWTGLL